MNITLLLFTGFAIGISGAMIPGPLTLFTVSQVLKTNKFAGLKIVAGHMFFEFLLIAATIAGLQKFLSEGAFLRSVSVIGGAALIAMGALLVIKSPKMKAVSAKNYPGFGRGLFLGGIFFTAMSPGFLVWWATIGVSTLMKSLTFGIAGAALLTIGHWSADTLWYWSLSYAVDKGKAYLSDKAYRNAVRFFAVLLLLLGIHFIYGANIY